jgi:hypothetical protein
MSWLNSVDIPDPSAHHPTRDRDGRQSSDSVLFPKLNSDDRHDTTEVVSEPEVSLLSRRGCPPRGLMRRRGERLPCSCSTAIEQRLTERRSRSFSSKQKRAAGLFVFGLSIRSACLSRSRAAAAADPTPSLAGSAAAGVWNRSWRDASRSGVVQTAGIDDMAGVWNRS